MVILGAGCAGLSAAVAMLDAGSTGPILLIDSRTEYRDDRTWCFWDVEPTPFSHLARSRITTWEVRASRNSGSRGSIPPGLSARASAPATAYLSLAANDFYQAALDRLAESGTVGLLLGEPALGWLESPTEVFLTTASRQIRAKQIVDARGLRMPVAASPEEASPVEAAEARRGRGTRIHPSETWLPQAFVGLHIVTERPVFDPGSCLLMDFTVDQGCGLRFMYVVPVSTTEALVEHVFLTETTLSEVGFVAGIDLYLAREFGLEPRDYRVLATERGCIPMTDSVFRDRPSPRVTLLGTRGGATRPSTGYTFLRIQRSCRALAERLVRGTDVRDPADPPTRSLLDAIFLRFLADHPGRAPLVFHRMFDRVEPSALVRFLSEQSDWRDNARLILALPKGRFPAAAAAVLLGRVRHARH
ncbi:lycopene cyclase family protein [Subtercola boreus]|uniref:lycopene cyclase family protein n=1 Tax=Subtercola boreus TaxID=120213 RepID=UPI00155899C2|nr:lycopene cyclase family protein [Subtercola boreus]